MRISFLVFVVIVLFLGSSASFSDDLENAAYFYFPSDPEYLILSYSYHLPTIPPDPTPRVRIYGNGRVVVHRPLYKSSPGDFELQLSNDELDELLRSFEACGWFEATSQSIKMLQNSAREERLKAAGSTPAWFDIGTTEIALHLEEYAASGNPDEGNQLARSILAEKLEMFAEDYPEAREFGELYKCIVRLETFLDRHPAS